MFYNFYKVKDSNVLEARCLVTTYPERPEDMKLKLGEEIICLKTALGSKPMCVCRDMYVYLYNKLTFFVFSK